MLIQETGWLPGNGGMTYFLFEPISSRGSELYSTDEVLISASCIESRHILVIPLPRLCVNRTRSDLEVTFQLIKLLHLIVVQREIEDTAIIGDSRRCLGFASHHEPGSISAFC